MLGQVIVSGLAMGCIYALIALGYAYVWNTMAIVNFAAGEFLTFEAIAGQHHYKAAPGWNRGVEEKRPASHRIVQRTMEHQDSERQALLSRLGGQTGRFIC